MKMYTLLTISM